MHFVTQILRALSHAHEHGVIHRDIKSQNIMLLRDGTIKVMDFGIARFAREDIRTMDDKAIGSVHYISPEQACGEESDEKSDIYSVGVLLYEMLTGRVPFDGETPEQIAMKHINKKPVPIESLQPDVPTGLCEIVEKAMQKDKKLRYRSAAEMLAAIDAFKQNPSIVFEYKYMPDEPEATKYYRSVSAIQAEDRSVKQNDAADDDEEEIIIKRSPTILILTGIAAACVITAMLVLLGFFYWGRDEKVAEIPMPNLVGLNGRHTTRHVELYELSGGGLVADTPGFSTVEIEKYGCIRKEDLPECFREFREYLGECQFQNCSHRKEKGCAVLKALQNGEISTSRHESYHVMYEDAMQIREWELREEDKQR